MKKVEAFRQTLKWEKGIGTHPKDKGGYTHDGITYDHYERNCKEVLGYAPSVELFAVMSELDILKFYDRIWKRMLLDQVKDPFLAAFCFDFAFNSGNGKKEIQGVLRLLGYDISADNTFGPQTIWALNEAAKKFKSDLIDLIIADRIAYLAYLIQKDPNQLVFLKGWLNRIVDWRNVIQAKYQV